MQQLLEAGLVEDFDADVPVQRSRYQARHEVEDVAGDKGTAHRHALIGGVDDILALEAVHVDAEEDVDAEDESFCDEECFPEVERSSHLGHKLAVDHGAAVGEHGLHEAQDLATEVDAFWRTGAGNDRRDWWTDVDSILAMTTVSPDICTCSPQISTASSAP